MFTTAEILIGYEFSLGSPFCSTEDIGYEFTYTVNDVESATNSIITIETASKQLKVYSATV